MTRFGLQSNGGRRLLDALDGRSEPVSPRTHYRRHRLLTGAFSLLALLYAGRLGYLQLIEGNGLRARALAQSQLERVIPASRGEIVDRNGEALATDDTRYHVYLAPQELNRSRNRDEVIRAIESVVPLSPTRRARLATATQGWPTITAAATDEQRMRLVASIGSGLRFESNAARRYPRGDVARGLIGAVDERGAGRSGLELQLDSLLRGEPGARRIRVDARKGEYRSPDEVLLAARPGLDVVLTIDAGLQRIAETELDNAIERTGSSAGDIILYDPRHGDILALASRRLGGQAAVPAVSDPYEPGSTAKPFLLAALLNEGLVDLDEKIDVEGGELRDAYRVINDVHGYDTLSVRQIVAQSSNVGAAKLSRRLRPSVQHGYLRDFGFGMPTRIDYPGESSGELRRPAEWSKLSAGSLAMGYELSTTSLQLAAAYGALANDGILMRPRLIKAVRDHDGRVLFESDPMAVRRVVRAEVAHEVTGVLQEAVRAGTAKNAAMIRLAVAGKTGTAKLAVDGRYAPGRYRASFVGYAPADDPKVVILTRLEDPKGGAYYGGAIAAPTSQATLQAALATHVLAIDGRLVASDAHPRRWTDAVGDGAAKEPFIFAVGEGQRMWPAGRSDGEGAVPVPRLIGSPLRLAVARLHELGFRVEWRGTETVRQQEPAPGRALARGGLVVLR